jgi:hypothetical protein
MEFPVNAIFNDPRARLVPAHMLAKDRYDLNAPAVDLRVPSLWLLWTPAQVSANEDKPQAYQNVQARKSLVWLTNSPDAEKNYYIALTRWLGDLSAMPNP